MSGSLQSIKQRLARYLAGENEDLQQLREDLIPHSDLVQTLLRSLSFLQEPTYETEADFEIDRLIEHAVSESETASLLPQGVVDSEENRRLATEIRSDEVDLRESLRRLAGRIERASEEAPEGSTAGQVILALTSQGWELAKRVGRSLSIEGGLPTDPIGDWLFQSTAPPAGARLSSARDGVGSEVTFDLRQDELNVRVSIRSEGRGARQKVFWSVVFSMDPASQVSKLRVALGNEESAETGARSLTPDTDVSFEIDPPIRQPWVHFKWKSDESWETWKCAIPVVDGQTEGDA